MKMKEIIQMNEMNEPRLSSYQPTNSSWEQPQASYPIPSEMHSQQSNGYADAPPQSYPGSLMGAPASLSAAYVGAPPRHEPMNRPEQGRGLALAGFVLGIASMLGGVLGIVSVFVCIWFIHSAGLASMLAIYGILLEVPITITGITLSAIGLRSISRRTIATWGLILSIIALILTILSFLVLVVGGVLYLAWLGFSHNSPYNP